MGAKKKVGRPSTKPFLIDVADSFVVEKTDLNVRDYLHTFDLNNFDDVLRFVVEYALRGREFVDEFSAPKIDRFLLYLSHILYSSVLRPAPNAISKLDQSDLDSEIAVVLMAAHARREIDRGAALSIAQIAALASLTVRGVQRLIDVGELQSLGGPKHMFSAAEARRFLSARGVRGL